MTKIDLIPTQSFPETSDPLYFLQLVNLGLVLELQRLETFLQVRLEVHLLLHPQQVSPQIIDLPLLRPAIGHRSLQLCLKLNVVHFAFLQTTL